MGQVTPLHAVHLALGATMTERNGWNMPLHYGNPLDEHNQVRTACGVFDVSHLGVVDIHGEAASDWLRAHLSNDVARLHRVGQAQYSFLLSETGGILADLLVYRLEAGFRLITDSACKETLFLALTTLKTDAVQVTECRDYALLAIQGPDARARCAQVVSLAQAAAIEQLAPFHARCVDGWFIARTGFTGEDGLEILLPAEQATAFFYELIGAGIAPAGLAARDILRVEAGFGQYGQDFAPTLTPLALSVQSVLAWEPQERHFRGRSALEQLRANGGETQRLVGLVLEENGVLRAGDTVRVEGVGNGVITSGGFSPCLEKTVALALVPAGTHERAEVELHGRWYPVRVVRTGFVRHGISLI